MVGRVANQLVVVLIDGGSTHNFVQTRLVRPLGLMAQATQPLRVVVGNGNEVLCQQLCTGVTVTIQNQDFTMDLHALPLCGADIVLGVQWLKSLGPVLTDYNNLTMKFNSDGHIVELKGDTDDTLQAITPPQLRRIVRTASAYFHISLIPPELPSTQTQPKHYPEIDALLNTFTTLFQTPTSLPPSRPTNHSIHLLPQSEPVNVRPIDILIFRNARLRPKLRPCYNKG